MRPFSVDEDARTKDRLIEIARVGGPHQISIASTTLEDQVFSFPRGDRLRQAIPADEQDETWVHIELDYRTATASAGEVLSGYVYFNYKVEPYIRTSSLTLQLVGHE